jgi:hypothetical protein
MNRGFVVDFHFCSTFFEFPAQNLVQILHRSSLQHFILSALKNEV